MNKNLNQIIKRHNLYTIDHEEGNSIVKLSSQNHSMLFQFLNFLSSKNKGKFNYVFRGTSNLNAQYNVDTHNISLLSDIIFMVGEKGFAFWKDCKSDHGCTLLLDEDKDEAFEIIWDRIHNKVCNNSFNNENTRSKIDTFIRNNPSFYCYFANVNNHEHFIYTCINSHCKSKIKDYYYSFLHTIGKSGWGKSAFLSTSTDYVQANNFKNDGILIYGWIPKKDLKKSTIRYQDINRNEKEIRKIGLPVYSVSVYSDQKEICLKCGFLPHFIIGFSYKNKFIVNPAIFNNQYDESTIFDGLCVDQSKFTEYLNFTNYKRSYIFYEGSFYCM